MELVSVMQLTTIIKGMIMDFVLQHVMMILLGIKPLYLVFYLQVPPTVLPQKGLVINPVDGISDTVFKTAQ